MHAITLFGSQCGKFLLLVGVGGKDTTGKISAFFKLYTPQIKIWNYIQQITEVELQCVTEFVTVA